MSAAQLNAANAPLRTVFEEAETKTYPDNVELRCDTAFRLHPEDWKLAYELGELQEFLSQNEEDWWRCDLLRYRVSHNGEFLYTVHLYEADDKANTVNDFLVEDIPRQAFHFVDLPYTADAHQPNAFRHDIRIPDEIFPQPWRNLRKHD
jgi:hypothetical protein